MSETKNDPAFESLLSELENYNSTTTNPGGSPSFNNPPQNNPSPNTPGRNSGSAQGADANESRSPSPSPTPFSQYPLPYSPDGSSRRRSRGGGSSDAFLVQTLLSQPAFQDIIRQTIQSQIQDVFQQILTNKLMEMVPVFLSKYLTTNLPIELNRRINLGIINKTKPCTCCREARDSGFLANVSYRT